MQYPDLPLIVAVHDMYSLREDKEIREPCRYIAEGGESTFEISEAVRVGTPEESGQLIVGHKNFGHSGVYYQPQFYVPTWIGKEFNEAGIETLRAWHQSYQG